MEERDVQIVEFNGDYYTYEYDNGMTHIFDVDGANLFSLQAGERLSEWGIKFCLVAYQSGIKKGEQHGKYLARQEIRVALGIEGYDL